MGVERSNTRHFLHRILEKPQYVRCAHLHASGQPSPRVSPHLFRQHESSRGAPISERIEGSSQRTETIPALGRVAGTSGKNHSRVPRHPCRMATRRTTSGLCARTQPHRIPLVSHEAKRYGKPPAGRPCPFETNHPKINASIIKHEPPQRIPQGKQTLLT